MRVMQSIVILMSFVLFLPPSATLLWAATKSMASANLAPADACSTRCPVCG